MKYPVKITFSKEQMQSLKKLGVQTVYLFGSYATGKYIHNASDIDIGILFENPAVLEKESLNVYSALYDIVTNALPHDYLKKRFQLKAHEVDIVFLQQTPIRFQFQVIKDGKVLYEGDKERRLQYEEYVMKMRCDLDYIYKLSYKHLLERI